MVQLKDLPATCNELQRLRNVSVVCVKMPVLAVIIVQLDILLAKLQNFTRRPLSVAHNVVAQFPQDHAIIMKIRVSPSSITIVTQSTTYLARDAPQSSDCLNVDCYSQQRFTSSSNHLYFSIPSTGFTGLSKV